MLLLEDPLQYNAHQTRRAGLVEFLLRYKYVCKWYIMQVCNRLSTDMMEREHYTTGSGRYIACGKSFGSGCRGIILARQSS